MIHIYYFAGLKDVTGKSEETLDCQQMTVSELKKWAVETYPGFVSYSVHVAVNEEYALDSDVISTGDTVAFIPPVSGG